MLQQSDSTAKSLINRTGGNALALEKAIQALLAKLPQVQGTGGDVQIGRSLAAHLNLTEKEATKRGDDFIAGELFLLVLWDVKGDLGKDIKAAGITLPEAFVCGDDVENGKPAPDPYLLGAKRLGIDPSDCIVFEDADAGIKSALAAKVGFVIGVSVRALDTDADIVIEDLAGISFDGKQLVIPEHKILRR
jgi:hypothetical protein